MVVPTKSYCAWQTKTPGITVQTIYRPSGKFVVGRRQNLPDSVANAHVKAQPDSHPKGESDRLTHVSGTFCYLCLGMDTLLKCGGISRKRCTSSQQVYFYLEA